MMETQRSCQHILIAVVFFLVILYVYYTPTLNWFKCPTVQVSKAHDCADACVNALQTSNHSHIRNNVNFTRVTKPNKASESETLLLIWTWPFGVKSGLGSCGSHFHIEGCQLTDDRNLFDKAHGVLFHHGDIHEDLPTRPRPHFQKWVWMNMESPSNSVRKSHLNAVFNLTATYRRDSDISVPYGHISQRSDEDTTYTTPQKNKLICWIVTNWNSNYERSKYYDMLKEHISVETYGASFDRHVSDEDYPRLVSSCKFYLSFENSIHEDYITEKLYSPMSLGTVPVVLGPSRKNYEMFIPAGAFIHVDDFRSAEELAAHLKLLDQNTDMYMKFFSWRERYTARGTWFGLEHACRSCDHIRRNRNYRTVNDLNTWFWGF